MFEPKTARGRPGESKREEISGDKEASGEGEKSVIESPRECKQLLKTMILGVKTVVWSVSNSRMAIARESRRDSLAPLFLSDDDLNELTFTSLLSQEPHPLSGSVLQKGMSESEALLVAKLLKKGLQCFAIYSRGPDATAQELWRFLNHFQLVSSPSFSI